MGHYASELSEPNRYEPKILDERRKEDREHAQFVWNRQSQREEQGVWIDAKDQLICPFCFALIPAVLRQDHNAWHVSLEEDK